MNRSWDQSETWRQMEELYASGKVKAIGVANWSIPYLEDLRKTWKIVPAVNQVELHPYLPQHELRAYCEKLGILLEAYSPLGSTGALRHLSHVQSHDANISCKRRRSHHVRPRNPADRRQS